MERESAQAADDEISRRAQELMEGLPPVNIGALLVPPLWGPAHGLWATILFYPAWIFADNALFAAYTAPSALSIILAVIIAVVMAAVTVAFARLAWPIAAHRAAKRGKDRQRFVREQRIWAIAGALVAVAIVALATFYNLSIRSM